MKKGFTLIELLVSIAIIGILASVVVASVNGARTKANVAALKSQLKFFITQSALVYQDYNSYASVCDTGSTPYAYLVKAREKNPTGATGCQATAEEFVAWVGVNESTDVFCVDNNGFSNVVSTAPTTMSCE